MIKAIIIDDEKMAIRSLVWELSNFKSKIKVVKTFTCAKKAIDFLKSNKIDCLFLDIEMPKMDGFQFLEKLKKRDFAVIITTAYSKYAIKAIKNEAIDYLLKPIDTDDLKLTLKKVERFKNKKNKEIEKILLSFNEENNNKKIVINTDGKMIFINPNEIIFVESDGNYSSIMLESNKKVVITKKLKEVYNLLPCSKFFRVHNSYVVNLNKIDEFLKNENYILLKNKHKIPVSRYRKSEFLNKF